MTSKTKKILVSVSAVIMSLLIAAWGLNRYYYSWTGLLLSKIDLCDYKSVSVMGNNGYPKQMSFRLDPQFIAQEMSKHENYKVNARYNGDGAVVMRNFDGVIYKLFFQARGGSFLSFDLGTGLNDPRYEWPVTGGERCATPSYVLRKNAFKMIDDLPMTVEQKDELKGSVWVIPTSTLKSFF